MVNACRNLPVIKKSKFFEIYKNDIFEIFSYSWNNLSEFNIFTIKKICELLKIKVNFVILSEISFNLKFKSTDALVEICKLVWANEYLSWAWWKNYIDESKFLDSWIKIHYQEFSHPVYTQLWGEFIPYMSIIDLIFNNWNNF